MKKANNPIVSVIVPVYNVAPYLQRCIYSLTRQTLWDIEIILIDDGSTDNSPEICDNAAKKDERIKVIHKENGGAGSARNAGLDIATGKYISFVDSDDFVEADMMQKMVAALENANAQISVCNVVKHENKKSTYNCLNLFSDVVDFSDKNLNYFFDVYGSKISILGCNKLYCFDILKKYNIKFIDMDKVWSEDQLFMISYFRFVKKAAFIDESLYHYEIREGSLCHRKTNCKILNQWINLVKEIKKFVDENDPESADENTYQIVMWNYLCSAINCLENKNNFDLAITLVNAENMKFLKNTFFSVAFKDAGKIIAKKQQLSFKATVYFRFMAFLMWLGEYKVPLEKFFGIK